MENFTELANFISTRGPTDYDGSGESTLDLNFIFGICCGITGFLGICGNGLVLLVIILAKEMHNATNILVANQSLIDFTSAVILVLQYIPDEIKYHTWKNQNFASFICTFWSSQFFFWSFMKGSTFNLMLLTFERYLAIVYPFTFRRYVTGKRVLFAATLPWIMGLVYDIYKLTTTKMRDGICHYEKFWHSPELRRAFGYVFFAINYVIPIIFIFVLYTSIFRTLKKNDISSNRGVKTIKTVSKESINENNGSNGHIINDEDDACYRNDAYEGEEEGRYNGKTASHRMYIKNGANKPTKARPASTSFQKGEDINKDARRNVVNILFIVSMSFVICWTPNQIYYFLQNIELVTKNLILHYFTIIWAYGNMWINPLIYFVKYKKFQRAFRNIFRLKRSKHDSSQSLSSHVYSVDSA